jgi:hypothetical protein
LKRSITFVLVPYSDSVYKTTKTHFDLLLLNCYTAEKLSHLYSTLGCCGRGAKTAVAGEGRAEAAQGASRGGRKKNDRRKELARLFTEKLNCNQGLKLNYRSVIHPTSELSM